MDIGFKHFTALQWTGVFFIVSLPLLIIALVAGYRPPYWGVVLGANIFGVLFSVGFIGWPGKNGFEDKQ